MLDNTNSNSSFNANSAQGAPVWESGWIDELWNQLTNGTFNGVGNVVVEGDVTQTEETIRSDIASLEHVFIGNKKIRDLLEEVRSYSQSNRLTPGVDSLTGSLPTDQSFAKILQHVHRKGLPDLEIAIDSVQLPAEISPGTQGSIAVTLSNQGGLRTQTPATVKVYAAQGNQAVEIGKTALDSLKLKPNKQQQVSVQVAVPTQLATGTYALYVVVDTAGNLPEQDSSNNVALVTGTQLVIPGSSDLNQVETTSLSGTTEGADTHSCVLPFAIRAEGQVSVNGNSDFDGDPLLPNDDALIYGGRGFTLNGQPILPVQRDADGNPIRDQQGRAILLENAVAVSADYQQVNASTNQYSGLVPPQVVETQTVVVPSHGELVDSTLAQQLPTGVDPIEFNVRQHRLNNSRDWDSQFPAGGSAENPTVIRVTGGGLTIPNRVSLENTILLVENGDVNFNGSGHQLNNVTIVAENGGVNLSNVEGHDVTVMASRQINMNGGARFAGRSLLASQNSVTFNGATTTEADRLKIVSQGNITFNGSSDTRAQFLAAGNFFFNGRSTLYGRINVKGNITFNGRATVVATNDVPIVDADKTIVVAEDSGATGLDIGLPVDLDEDEIAIRVEEIPDTDKGVVRLAGGSAVAVGQTLSLTELQTLSFETVADANGAAGRFSYVADDGWCQPSRQDVTLHITPVNDGPVITAPAALSLAEDTTLAFASGLQIRDVDAGELPIEATLSVGQGQLLLNGTAERSVTLTGTVAALNAQLAELIYRPDADYAGADALEIVVSDLGNTGEGGALSDTATIELTITPVNDAPVLAGPALVSIPEDTRQPIPELAVTDIDAEAGDVSVQLSVEQGTILLGETAGLSLLSGDFAGASTIAFKGSLIAVNQALETLSYQGIANYAGADTLVFTVNDLGNTGAGGALSQSLAVGIQVTPVNDAPILSMPVELMAIEAGLDLPVGGVAISDVDAANGLLSITILVGNGELRLLNEVSGITVESGDAAVGSSTLTLSGTLSALNDALTSLTYRADERFSGMEMLAVSVDDLGNTGEGGPLTDSAEISFEVTPAGIYLEENSDFVVTGEEVFVIPQTPTVLQFTYTDFFDTSDTFDINDAFEAALLDAAGNSLIHTFSTEKDTFFNLTEGLATTQAAGVTVEGQTVTVDLSDIPAGTEARLVLRLVNNDDDTQSAVRIQNIELLPGEDNGVISATPVTPQPVPQGAVDFGKLEDVSGWLTADYGRSSFNEQAKELSVEVAALNQSLYEVRGTALMVIEGISADDVRVLNADGITPEGSAYFNLSHLLGDEALAGGEQSGFRQVLFANPTGEQFDYQVRFLSQLNVAPEFVSEPVLEALVGKEYRYDALATDSDGDTLSYSLVNGPEGLTVDSDTGEILWTPVSADLGTAQVTVQVEDGHGGTDEQTFTLVVRENVPNRPPVITTTPVVDATVGEAYAYDVDAKDLDGDELTYQLLDAPEGMVIDETTGAISWNPAVADLGVQAVEVEVSDSKGGVVTQTYEIAVAASRENTAPVITSLPLLRFQLAQQASTPIGNVSQPIIDLDLGLGEQFAGEISLTLPSDSDAGQSFADVVFVVDESGSMSGEHAWIRNMVLDLNAALEEEGIGPNYFSLIGYLGSPRVFQIDGNPFGTADELSQVARGLRASGGTEDGYRAIDRGLDFDFRDGSAVNFILVTDEDRDNTNSSFTFNSLLTSLTEEEALLNAVVNARFSSNGQSSLGVDFEGNSYQADGAGDFILNENGVYNSGSGTTKRDYIDLAWASGGAAWDLNKLRAGGTTAQSFTEAFVDIKAEEIKTQLGIEVIASDPNVQINNLTGEISGLGGGDTASFDIELTGDGNAQSFDLLFVRPDTNIVLGSIPVTINNDYLYNVKAVDADGDVLTYSLTEAPSDAAIDPDTGRINWEPPADGDYAFTVQVSDGRGGIDQQSYTVTVTDGEINTQPTITSTAPLEALYNQDFRYQVEATDPDVDYLNYYLGAAPEGMSIDRESGQLTWTPTDEQGGEQAVTVRVLDGRGGEATQTFTLTVGEDLENSAPEIVSAPLETVQANVLYRYQVEAQDLDNDALRYDLSLAPKGMTIDENSGEITWRPTTEQEGNATVVVRAQDGRGGIDLQAFNLRVGEPNVAPVITSSASETATAGFGYEYRVRAQDADGEVVSYRLADAPDGMTINEAAGIIRWTPTVEQLGAATVTVTAIDDQGAETSQIFAIEVLETTPNEASTVRSSPRMLDVKVIGCRDSSVVVLVDF